MAKNECSRIHGLLLADIKAREQILEIIERLDDLGDIQDPATVEEIANQLIASGFTYTKEEINELIEDLKENDLADYALKTDLDGKQDTIDDLSTIRSGAALGSTALQSFTEADPTVPIHVKSITENDISAWNGKSDFSGDYEDLENKPDIPDVVANPDGEATGNLTKIGLNGEIFTVSSGSGSATYTASNGITISDDNQISLLKVYRDYLDEMTFKKPAISTFTLLNASGSALGTSYENGVVLTATKIKHKETNIDNISGNLTFNSQSFTPVSVDTTVELTTPITISSYKANRLSGKDTRNNAIYRDHNISFINYCYSKVCSDTEPPTSGLTKENTTLDSGTNPAGKLFSYSAGDYLYLYRYTAGTAETSVLGNWVAVEVTSYDSIEITRANGVKGNFHVYRIGPFISSGSATYRLRG